MQQITIIVPYVDEYFDEEVKVNVTTSEGIPFGSMMSAAEYMMYLVATKSDAGFEKALELLVQGALTYKTIRTQESGDD